MSTIRLVSFLILPSLALAQIGNVQVSATPTQAILTYNSPIVGVCSVKVADMNRQITVSTASKTGSTVTITTLAPHGLLSGAVIYLEGSNSAWNGWQTVAAVLGPDTFTFISSAGTAGSTSGGNVGVLVDDINPRLFSSADQDSRPGNANNGYSRTFVIGQRTAPVAGNGNRYSRALQAASRHHLTLTCGTQKLDQEFTTANLALGDTHNEPLPSDRAHPGQYAYPTIQWNNPAQSLIDPQTGVRSFRATGPQGTPSATQNFGTALDPNSAWSSPSAVLAAGGTATYSGSCSTGSTCPLFLRADSLSLPGGATLDSGFGEGVSLDWFTVTVANVSAPSCSGDGCKLEACLSVNGMSCATPTRETVLTSSPATYTIGTKSIMDLWQNSGPPPVTRPDATRATGTVNYNASTRLLTVASGNNFNVKWTAGSRITVNGVEYAIGSVRNENEITLVNGPASNLTGASYFANNFGVLLWKKTTGALSIGQSTYQYGSSYFPGWNSFSTSNCGPAVTVNGVVGFNCFVDQELYWIAQDGSDLRDLGAVHLSWWPDGRWSASFACGESTQNNQFDPTDGDTWYCLINLYFDQTGRYSFVKAHYNGPHNRYTPGATLPDCGLNGNVQPCIAFTIMQPNKSDAINISGPAFSPEYQASGYPAAFWLFGGISPEGDAMIVTREVQGQDTLGWQFLYTLGDRTPAGTTANSMRPIAAGSSYLHAPLSWCYLHATATPQSGWAQFSMNDFSFRGSGAVYSTTLTSGALNKTPGAAGGLNACPSNPFGITGQVCTAITVAGDPTRGSDGTVMQPIQPGDLIKIDTEYLRVLVRNSPTSFVVQRGYISTPTAHTSLTLPMACGVRNAINAQMGYWDYRDDPYGTNATGTTMYADLNVDNGHGGGGDGVFINAPDGWWDLGQTLCPSALLGSITACYQVRRGSYATLLTAPVMTVAADAPFAGQIGIGTPNTVDSHPGPCTSSWCFDARPMLGGTATGNYTNITGQLWKTSGATLNRKFLATMAYASRSGLIDVSGPSSNLTGNFADSYKYCVANRAGECHAGSAAGDVFVNAPYVSIPYCNYWGVGYQLDDTNMICVGDLGTLTGNLVQVGVSQEDLAGAGSRRLGTMYSRWNQQPIFWNNQATPTGSLGFSQVRWLDGARHEDLVTILPPYPAQDGVARNTFATVPVALTPPAGVAANTAVVEFGYGENGDPGSFFCTSRQEACVAVSSVMNTGVPFYYEQTESYSGSPCAFGCNIAIPALPEHVVYYRAEFRNASGQVVYTGPVQAAVTR